MIFIISKCFLNNWDFIKVISKPGFADYYVLQKNWCEASRPVLGHIFQDIRTA